jgi:NitT/TauT family transport system ATP-binding protein
LTAVSPARARLEVEANSMTDVTFDAVGKHYRQGDREVHALRGCSLHVEGGEFFSLLGPSGTGKTTLLNLVAGFERPDSGQVLVAGRPVTRPGPSRAVVFQAPTLFPWLSALDNVARGIPGRATSRRKRRRAALAQLEEVGLADAAGRHPYQLSGGMQQRVGIARALAMEPEVLLMDEPFAALDAYVRQEVQQLIVALWRRRRVTTLFVTHSIEEALLVSTRIGIMSGGQVTDTFDVPFEHPRDATAPEFNRLRREIRERIEAGVRAERAAQ